MDRIKSDDYKGILTSLLIAAGAVLLAVYFPVFILVLPFALAYVLVSGGYILGGAAFAFCILAGYLINPQSCALLTSVLLPPAVAAGIVVRKRLRFRHSVLAVSAAALCGAVLFIGVLWLMTGVGPVDYAASVFGRSLSALDDTSIKAYYQIFRYADVLTGAVTQSAVLSTTTAQAIDVMQNMLRESLDPLFTSYVLIYALAAGLLFVVIIRAFARKRGLKVCAVPAFSEFTLPRRFWLAYFLSFLVGFIGADLGWQGFDIAVITIHGVYAFVFTIQGLSLLDFLYKKRRMGSAVRVVLHILVSILLGSIIMLAGLFENIAGLRARLEQKGGTVS